MGLIDWLFRKGRPKIQPQQDAKDSSYHWHMRTICAWPASLIPEADANGLHLSREDVANLPTMDDLFSLVRLEAACANPNRCTAVTHYNHPQVGPRGGFKARQKLLELVAAGRSCISQELPQPGRHPVVVVSPGRHLMFFPSAQWQPSNDRQPLLSGDVASLANSDSSSDPLSSRWTELMQPPGASSCNIAVIAYTWGLLRTYHNFGYQNQAVQDYLRREGKDSHDLIKDFIPFFDRLLDLAYFGHNVWVFDSHPLTLPAGCRDADAILVDSGAASFLQQGWPNIAAQVMRGRERQLSSGEAAQVPIWFYHDTDRSFRGMYNITPGHPCDGFQGSVAEWLGAGWEYNGRPASMPK